MSLQLAPMHTRLAQTDQNTAIIGIEKLTRLNPLRIIPLGEMTSAPNRLRSIREACPAAGTVCGDPRAPTQTLGMVLYYKCPRSQRKVSSVLCGASSRCRSATCHLRSGYCRKLLPFAESS